MSGEAVSAQAAVPLVPLTVPLCRLMVTSGSINLNRIGDTIYTVDFTPYNGISDMSALEVDLDYIEVDETTNIVTMRNYDWNKTKEFHALDTVELKLFKEAKSECEAITLMRLRLGSVFRDAYYSGLYTRVSPRDDIIVSNCVDLLRKKTGAATFFNSLTHPEAALTAKNLQPRPLSHITNKRKSEPPKSQHFIEDINCLYCRDRKIEHSDQSFYIHPYVPLLFDQKHIYFCKTCIEAWKEYRTTVELNDELVLVDETNEEICALCSDSPETLILCSLCPRSFCHTCLQKAIPADVFLTVTADNETDWVCMSCANKQIADPPLHRSAWKVVEPCKTGFLGSHSLTRHVMRDVASTITGSDISSSCSGLI
jgi:hypothetical protein